MVKVINKLNLNLPPLLLEPPPQEKLPAEICDLPKAHFQPNSFRPTGRFDYSSSKNARPCADAADRT
jgi:hypothetical protein